MLYDFIQSIKWGRILCKIFFVEKVERMRASHEEHINLCFALKK